MAYATRVTGREPIRLDAIATDATGDVDEAAADRRLADLSAELRELQDLIYAAETHALLVILQGMDAAGKDVTIGNVFDAINPQASRVVEASKPTEEEAAHDFLWRAHAPMPKLGETVIFDRSYYEQVISDRVMGEATEEIVRRRYEHINAFERLLADDGQTIVLKFFLHIGFEEQGRRLEERQETAEMAWKISARDWESRARWDDFLAAYEAAINACATDEAPWYVVPSDHQWFHNLAIAEALVDRLHPFREGWVAARERQGEENREEARQARAEID